MAQYFTSDFADWSTDWTARYNTSTPDWSAALSGGDVTIPQSASGDWSLNSWNDIEDGNHAEIDVLLLVNAASFTGTPRFLVLRGSGADETPTHVHVSILGSGYSIGYCAGSDTRTNIATHSATYSTGTDYWVRVRISGTGTPTYKTKVWSGLASDEPGGAGSDTNWNLNSTDTNIPDAAGWVGLSWTGSSGSGFVVKQIGVGTNGDTAPSSGGGGAAALESSVSAAATVSAGLTTAIQCAASVSGSASVSAALTTAIQCAASVSATATVLASLAGGAAALEASASAAATVAAGLTTAIQCAASVACSATVSASLTTGAGGIAADVSGSASVSGALTTAIRCAASVTGTATVSASLAGAAAALQASASASAAVSATLTGSAAQLAAAVIAQAQATSALSTAIRLAASLQLSATPSASLTAGPLDVFVREPHPFTLHGVPRERMVRLDKPARQIGELLKGQ